jgi:hypothetical protein
MWFNLVRVFAHKSHEAGLRTFETATLGWDPGSSNLLPSGGCLSGNPFTSTEPRSSHDRSLTAIPLLSTTELNPQVLSCLTTPLRSLHFHDPSSLHLHLDVCKYFLWIAVENNLLIHHLITDEGQLSWRSYNHPSLLLIVSQLNYDRFTTQTINSIQHYDRIIGAQHPGKSGQFSWHAKRWGQRQWRKSKSDNLDHQQYYLRSSTATHAYCPRRYQYGFGSVCHFPNMVWLVENEQFASKFTAKVSRISARTYDLTDSIIADLASS